MSSALIVVVGEDAAAVAAQYVGIDGHDVFACAAPDAAALERLGLYAHPDSARRCRDYALLAAADAHPGYAWYWLIDQAVFIHTAAPDALFSALADNPADLVAPGFSARGPLWDWGRKMRAVGQSPFGCRLPLARFSARAVATLLQARRRHAAMPAVATPDAWPNDEAMVATTLASAGLACRDLNDAHTVWANAQSMGGLTHDAALLAAAPPDGLIYFPTRDIEGWTAQAEATLADGAPRARSVANPAGLRGPVAARELGRVGQACLDHPVLGDQALVPLMLAGRPADLEGLTRVFAADGTAAPVATAHPAICRLPPHHLGLVKATDFSLGEALKLRRFPRQAALPYAYDLEAMEMLLTVHAALGGVLARPFLYAGQRELARVVARVKLADLSAIYGPVDRAAAPVLVFSIGRTGSTLFKQLIGCATPRAFSEPDALTQLAESGRALATLPEATRQALIYYAVAPFMTVRLPGGADGRCVIKLRSQANGLAAEAARALPAAKFVFMLRERRAWARSTFRAFGLTPEATAGRLRQALRALRALQESAVDLSVISYEEVVADPFAAVARLTGADPHADPALHARVAAAAAADSQAGHGLSRERTGAARAGEADWLAAFEATWGDQVIPTIEQGLLF